MLGLIELPLVFPRNLAGHVVEGTCPGPASPRGSLKIGVSYSACVAGERRLQESCLGCADGQDNYLGPACQSTACFDLPEGLNLGPCDGLSQWQRFWMFRFLWNLLSTCSSKDIVAGVSGPAGVKWRCSVQPSTGAGGLLPHNCYCYSSGQLLASISFVKNCSVSSVPATVQGHPGGSRYWTGFWQHKERGLMTTSPSLSHSASWPSPSPSTAPLTHHP